MNNLWNDTETYCAAPIKDGTHRYAEDAEVMLWSYALDDGAVKVWDRCSSSLHYIDDLSGEWAEDPLPVGSVPRDLRASLADPETLVWFHNGGAFDMPVVRHALPKLYALVDESRWRDTMVQAYAHALPGALDTLGQVLNLENEKRKHARGRYLVLLFCKPTKDGKRNTRETHPDEWLEFVRYAGQDIVTMREAHRKMPMWNYRDREAAMWHLDLRINNRGFAVDLDLARGAVAMAASTQARLSDQVREQTDGAVGSATQRDALLAYVLEAHGVSLPDMKSDTLERRLDDPDLPEPVKDLLRIRLQAGRNASAKFKTLLKAVSKDGRLRGCMQFRGAGRTGREAHRLFQPGNLMRPTFKQPQIELAIEATKNGSLDLIFSDCMEALGNTVRGVVVAPPGKKLVVADLANIEGRVAAWLAGEEWKLQAFRDYDTILGYDEKGEPIRKGHDLYALSYARAFNITPEEVMENKKSGDGLMRQIGKVMELMLQYEGGVSAFITGAATYSIDLDAMAEAAFPTLPADVIGEAESFLSFLYRGPETKAEAALRDALTETDRLAVCEALKAAKLKARHGLAEKTFIVCDSLKRLWRRAHPAISSYWKGDFENPGLQITVERAINSPGETFTCRRLKIRRDGGWLRIQLPSGRQLCYPNIRIKDLPGGKTAICYTGLNQYTKQWGDVLTYGGKLLENCIAAGTLTLTAQRGWVPIESITSLDQVWDGDRWVETHGAFSKGTQPVISAYGALMTPDHRVLTQHDGWKHASQSAGYDRFHCRLPHGVELPQQRWEEVVVDGAVYLREPEAHGRVGTVQVGVKVGGRFVRVQAPRDDRGEEHEARNVGPSSVLGVAVHERQVPAALASRMGKLRRAGHQSLQAVARLLRRVLGRHGAFVPSGVDAGAAEERARLQPEQLRVGDAQGAGEQHAGQPEHQRRDRRATGRQARDQVHHVAVSSKPRGSGGAAGRSTEQRAEVFDLLNCGPRQRFTILAGGQPLIVHNCTQAVAADQLIYPLPAIEAAGYLPILHVHDEVVAETPDSEDFTADELGSMMCADLGWNAGLPLAAAGFEAYRYRKD